MDTICDRQCRDLLRRLIRQAFIPIFVADERDVDLQFSACRKAGLEIIEYTQRRRDSCEKIPELLAKYPETVILAGSTLDDDCIVRALRRRFPQLRTFSELAELGVSGFVSRLGFSEETFRVWRRQKLLIPCAGTVNEAYRQFAAGAHLIKVVSSDYDVVKQLAGSPVFGFCPVFVTGGASLETIPEMMEDGVLCVGAGFDAIMKRGEELPDDKYFTELVSRLKALQECAVSCRERRFPGLNENLESEDWLQKLPFACVE